MLQVMACRGSVQGVSDTMPLKKLDLTGQVFGYLTVQREAPPRYRKAARTGNRVRSELYWVCECVCGKVTQVRGSRLHSGETRSCGCLGRSVLAGADRTHAAVQGVGRGELARAPDARSGTPQGVTLAAEHAVRALHEEVPQDSGVVLVRGELATEHRPLGVETVLGPNDDAIVVHEAKIGEVVAVVGTREEAQNAPSRRK